MSKLFSVLLQEHNGWIQEARIELVRAVAVKDAFTDTRICELESDLESVREDLENEKDLTHKLRGYLDNGGLVGLVGELVICLNNSCCELFQNDIAPSDRCLDAIAKAKEIMP